MKIILQMMVVALAFAACRQNNVNINNELGKAFETHQTQGSFALFDNGSGEFTIYNMKDDTTRIQPAQTFHAVLALVGVETGRVNDERTLIPTPIPVRFDSAFASGNATAFQIIAQQIGKDTLQQYVDTLGYGNKKLGNAFDRAWTDGSLLISPDENLGLIKRLYFDQLPFQQRTQRIVRNCMQQENTANYKLSRLTGEGKDAKGAPIAWSVGWVEENKHPYFFSIQVKGTQATAEAVMRESLRSLGFFEGKK